MLGLVLFSAFFASAQCFIFGNIIPGMEVCYGDLGCFNSGPPFFSTHRLLSAVPQSPAKLQTKFLLYTRASPAVADEEVLSDVTSITGSKFNGSRPTKFIAHGFTHDGYRPWVQTMKSELLKKEDMNVIVVDWKNGASLPYDQATANTRVVGAQIAQLMKQLMTASVATAGSFHIIGHSLGAHVAGYAGERITHLGRISGLDPANPYFQHTDVSVRLDPSDADFVDVIHTDGTSITQLGFGAEQPMGHVDFYPNGGKDQPGCDAGLLGKVGHTVWNVVTAVAMLDNLTAAESVACSHGRSLCYFIESIKSSCPFTAYPCTNADEFYKGKCLRCYGDGCSQMGYNADKFKARGSLYLETEGTSSYCAAAGSVACSHDRSYSYFIDTIRSSCPFTAYPCTNADEFHKGNCLLCYGSGCSQMGYNADKFKARGSLYLETEGTSSYCDFTYQFNVTASNNFDGKLTVELTGLNGTTGPIQLMSDNEVHQQGTVISKLVRTRIDIGDIQSVTIIYDKTDGFLVGWAYPDDWHLTGASVWSGDKQTKLSFCAANKDAHSHQSATFGVQGNC